MVKRTGKAEDSDPTQTEFKIPSPKEHLFQVVDVFDNSYESNKFNLDINTVLAKCEVVGGEEEGRSLLCRLDIDFGGKGFWFTRLFLKAIGEPCRGEFEIDTENWIGKQFFATVVHNPDKKTGKVYANISEFNFEKMIQQPETKVERTKKTDEEIAWDD